MSDGHRVHVESIEEYVTDILNHIQLMREEHPQIPIFAVGHSMVSLFPTNQSPLLCIGFSFVLVWRKSIVLFMLCISAFMFIYRAE